MTIYKVTKMLQMSDSESYYHWGEEFIRGYNVSIDGAKLRIESLIKADMELNEDHPDAKEEIRRNVVSIYEGFYGSEDVNEKEFPLYRWQPIEIDD